MQKRNAFTIIELLVVVAIIAILIGILLPAIGKARDQALVMRSMSNLRQLTISHGNYGADHNDNQWTTASHNLLQYGDGSNLCSAVQGYWDAMGKNEISAGFNPNTTKGMCNPGIYIGQGAGNTATYWVGAGSGADMLLPISFETGFGFFGTWNLPSFNQYVGGRFYDPMFYAPKDYWLITGIGECFDAPTAFCSLTTTGWIYRPSYRLSPAALYTPDLFSKESFTMNEMWQMPGLLRVPTFSQARYPDLKTHQIEQHWLQRRRRDCAHAAPPFQTVYDGCWPYFFNSGIDSTPVVSYYDGHVDMASIRRAIDDNQLAITQGGANASLWHDNTPGIAGGTGYFHDYAYSDPGQSPAFGTTGNPSTSFHILTRDGILGRDKMSN